MLYKGSGFQINIDIGVVLDWSCLEVKGIERNDLDSSEPNILQNRRIWGWNYSLLKYFNITHHRHQGWRREEEVQIKQKQERKDTKGKTVIHTHVWVLVSQDGVTTPGHF